MYLLAILNNLTLTALKNTCCTLTTILSGARERNSAQQTSMSEIGRCNNFYMLNMIIGNTTCTTVFVPNHMDFKEDKIYMVALRHSQSAGKG